MSNPLGQQDIVGNLVTFAELALASSLTSAASTTSATVNNPGVASTVVLLVKLACGQATVALDAFETSADFGSPSDSVSITDTKEYYLIANTSATNTHTAVKITEAAGSGNTTAVTACAMLVLYNLSAGEDWHSIIGGGYNSVASTHTGDGSGTFSPNIA